MDYVEKKNFKLLNDKRINACKGCKEKKEGV